MVRSGCICTATMCMTYPPMQQDTALHSCAAPGVLRLRLWRDFAYMHMPANLACQSTETARAKHAWRLHDCGCGRHMCNSSQVHLSITRQLVGMMHGGLHNIACGASCQRLLHHCLLPVLLHRCCLQPVQQHPWLLCLHQLLLLLLHPLAQHLPLMAVRCPQQCPFLLC